MDIEMILSFIGASALLAIMPGPDNIFVLTESMTKGSRTGLAISFGLISGLFVHTLAAATGVSLLILKSATAFSIIKYLGAAYLLYLAFMTIREKSPEVNIEGDTSTQEKSFLQLMGKGFVMNVLNPKVALFFIALLPHFITEGGMHVTLQMIILGGLFAVVALAFFSLLSLLSGRFAGVLNSSRFWKGTKWAKTGVLATLGIVLALARK